MLDRPDRDQIHAVFNGGSGCYDLLLPQFLEDMTVTNLKKLFTVILKESYLNRDFQYDVAQPIEDWLRYLIEREKEHWGEASRTFQNEYRDASRVFNRTAQNNIKRKNNSMMEEVKAAKRAYEGFQKRLAIWNELKAKYVN